jgi:uncharacterized protein (DUF1778 family)
LTESQLGVIQAAAEFEGMSVSDFVLNTALRESGSPFTEVQKQVTKEDEYLAFLDYLNRPANVNQGLKELFEKQRKNRESN